MSLHRLAVDLETEAGTMDVQLFADLAPLNVANFLHLASVGFLDGTEVAERCKAWFAVGDGAQRHRVHRDHS